MFFSKRLTIKPTLLLIASLSFFNFSHPPLFSPLCGVEERFDSSISYSQASQDSFVYTLLYELLEKKDLGYYLDIGAYDPIVISNSYLFEEHFQWIGLSIDISTEYKDKWRSIRKNPLIIQDAVKCDYVSMLDIFPHDIDYLSLDVDGYYDIVLEQLLLSDHIFKVITIEHDCYRFGDIYKERERNILSSEGYYLLCPDVLHEACGSFEDWWIHPSAFPSSILSKLTSIDLKEKNHREIVEIIKKLSP